MSVREHTVYMVLKLESTRQRDKGPTDHERTHCAHAVNSNSQGKKTRAQLTMLVREHTVHMV